MTGALKVEEILTNKLKAYGKNPRKNDANIVKMANAITEFGFRVPILATQDGTIIDGHLRHKAALKLKLKTVPVVIVNDLSDSQVEALRLLTNKSVEWSAWDLDLLSDAIDSITSSGLDIALTGFDVSEIDEIDTVLVNTQLSDNIKSSQNRTPNIKTLVKCVISVDELEIVETAILLTKEMNRGKAITKICEDYINEKRQFGVDI